MVARILVVEPDECIAEAFSNALASRGFEVITASNERDSRRHLCESAPDVVVLEPDAMGTWGRKLLSSRGRTPLVVVSRFSPHESVVGNEIQWLTKPVATAELFQAVTRAMVQ